MFRRTVLVTLAVAAAALATAAPSLAQPIGFTINDRAGDEPNPQLDLRGVRVAFDQATGNLNVAVALGAPPTNQFMNGVWVDLGQSDRQTGRCEPLLAATVDFPEPPDTSPPEAELGSADGSTGIGLMPLVVNGPVLAFSSVPADPAAVAALRGRRLNCAGVHTSVTRTLDTADRIADQPLLTGPKPRCKIGPRSVRGGRSFRFACKGAPRKVGVSIFPQRGRDVFSGTERPRRGRFRVPAIKSIRGGKAYISLFQGDTAFARFLVRIR